MSDELLKEFGFIIDEDDDGYFFETIDGEDHVRVKPFVGVIWKALSAARAEVEALKQARDDWKCRHESLDHQGYEVARERDDGQNRSSRWAAECGMQQAIVSILRARLHVVEDLINSIRITLNNSKSYKTKIDGVLHMIAIDEFERTCHPALSPEAPKYGGFMIDPKTGQPVSLDKMAEPPKPVCVWSEWEHVPQSYADRKYKTGCGLEISPIRYYDDGLPDICLCGRPIVEKPGKEGDAP